jgi:hypothetical protein
MFDSLFKGLELRELVGLGKGWVISVLSTGFGINSCEFPGSDSWASGVGSWNCVESVGKLGKDLEESNCICG